MPGIDDERLRRLRLAAQRLTPATAADGARAAARAVVGVQAQDVRAAALALRSRVPGLRRADVDGSGLIRTWTKRGTVHLVDPCDWPWLHAALGQRNRARFDAEMRKRGDYDAATGMLGDLVAALGDGPLDRAALLTALGDEAAATDDNETAAQTYREAWELASAAGELPLAASLAIRRAEVGHLLGERLDTRIAALRSALDSLDGIDGARCERASM